MVEQNDTVLQAIVTMRMTAPSQAALMGHVMGLDWAGIEKERQQGLLLQNEGSPSRRRIAAS